MARRPFATEPRPAWFTAIDMAMHDTSWLALIIGSAVSAWLNGHYALTVGDTIIGHIALPVSALLAGIWAEFIMLSSHPRALRWSAGVVVLSIFGVSMIASYLAIREVIRASMAHLEPWIQSALAGVPDLLMLIGVSILISHRIRDSRQAMPETKPLPIIGAIQRRRQHKADIAAWLYAEQQYTERVRVWLAAESAWKAEQHTENVRAWLAAETRWQERVRVWLAAEQEWKDEQQHAESIRLWLAAESAWKADQADRERVRLWLAAESEWKANRERIRLWLAAESAWKAEQQRAERVRLWLAAESAWKAEQSPAQSERKPAKASVKTAKPTDSTPRWTAEQVPALAERLREMGKTNKPQESVERALMLYIDGAPTRVIAAEAGAAQASVISWRDAANELIAAGEPLIAQSEQSEQPTAPRPSLSAVR